MILAPKIPRAVARKLGYYVYLYVNPLDDRVFYVGKGRGSRALAHLGAHAKKAVAKVIATIRAAGEEPRIDILVHGLPNEEAAFRIETAVIDALKLESLALHRSRTALVASDHLPFVAEFSLPASRQ